MDRVDHSTCSPDVGCAKVQERTNRLEQTVTQILTPEGTYILYLVDIAVFYPFQLQSFTKDSCIFQFSIRNVFLQMHICKPTVRRGRSL
jgi:hypothetical protein